MYKPEGASLPDGSQSIQERAASKTQKYNALKSYLSISCLVSFINSHQQSKHHQHYIGDEVKCLCDPQQLFVSVESTFSQAHIQNNTCKMATAGAPPIPPFNVDSDRSNVGYRWKKWLEKFENYLVAVNIADDRRQKALLLLYGGDQLYDIATSLNMTPNPAAGNGANAVPAETHFAAAKRVLTAHFHPQENKQFNQIAFRQLAQKTEESIDQFYARVKEHAAGCEFPDADTQIRTQLICGTRSKRFRSLALSDASSTLSQLLDKGKALEQSDARLSELESPGTSGQPVNALRSGSSNSRNHQEGSQRIRKD